MADKDILLLKYIATGATLGITIIYIIGAFITWDLTWSVQDWFNRAMFVFTGGAAAFLGGGLGVTTYEVKHGGH